MSLEEEIIDATTDEGTKKLEKLREEAKEAKFADDPE